MKRATEQSSKKLPSHSMSMFPDRARVYSVVHLAESCNISVKDAEDFIAHSDIDCNEHGGLNFNQFTKLKQDITKRSALFSNSFNPYYVSENESKNNKIKQDKQSKYNIGSDYDINTTHLNDVYCSDIATVDTNDIHQQKLEILVDNFSVICHKLQHMENGQREEKQIQIKLNGHPSNKKQTRYIPTNSKTEINYSRNKGKQFHKIQNHRNSDKKPRIRHNWHLDIKYDAQKQCISVNVTDSVSRKHWRRILTKYECLNGDVKNEYFKLGKLMSIGTIRYSDPHKGNGNIQICISTNNEIYKTFVAPI